MKKESNKTLAVTVRFWTNDLPEKVGKKSDVNLIWGGAMVIMEANKARGIKADSKPAHSFEDIPDAIAKLLDRANVMRVAKAGR